MALRTVTPNHHYLHQISLYAHRNYRNWLELDHLLTQLWESHPIRLKISYYALQGRGGEVVRSRMFRLLPEVTSRGIANFVEQG